MLQHNQSLPDPGMKISKLLIYIPVILLLFACKDDDPAPNTESCPEDPSLATISSRNFAMGFSTWSYGPDHADIEATYQFIGENSDIYSEQIDNKIPWSAWINGGNLPTEFVQEINYRVSKKPQGHQILLSVGLLNGDRSDLLEDYDGSIPSYNSMNDQLIEDAYFKHLDYLISAFEPDYLVMAMEVNELRIKSASKWSEYKQLMSNIRTRLKNTWPDLPLAESVTLHNWYNPEVDTPSAYIAEISEYVKNSDFAAISYYPFFKGQHSKSEFQQAFNFLHSEVAMPIAFVETAHLAEDLVVDSYNVDIRSDVCEQQVYLEVLLLNASAEDYEFVIWWTHRDYDELWKTFPDEVKDIGQLWRDTGLLNESGDKRPAYAVWQSVFSK